MLQGRTVAGKDGKGALPSDFWATYSAFANTDGGIILLGVSEKENGVFEVIGVEEPGRVLQSLWTLLNNPQKISRNLLSDASVRQYPTRNGRWVIEIEVRRATRKERPVFINGNPLTGTYKRLHSGDCRCLEEDVKRMLAEQMEDTRDSRILHGFGLDDLNMETVDAYRNRLSAVKSDHPFLSAKTPEFLRKLGCFGKDRNTGEEGLTLAGLLMFGRQETILEALPYFFLDYREIPASGTKTEWTDRLVPDGTWSGNLYDFYRMVILRLFRDLKVPFRLNLDERQDDTPVHKSLREALVNTIIHADYSLSTALLIVKGPDYFEFRNPGRMRVPMTEALEGGQSDCRNRIMQRLFSLIGLGEQAGSGIPRMLENWKSQHYRPPELFESVLPEFTTMRLRTVSLLPEPILAELREHFGESFEKLSVNERMALVTARIEGYVSNIRLRQIFSLHPHDITLLLRELVGKHLFESDGKGRGMTYRIAGIRPVDRGSSIQANEESPTHKDPGSTHKDPGSTHKDPGSTHKDPGSTHKDPGSTHKDPGSTHGEVASDPCGNPALTGIVQKVQSKSRANRNDVRSAILELCKEGFQTPQQLSKLLNRSQEGLRERYIKPLINEMLLERRYPSQPNHEQQAYRTRRREE